MIKLGSIFSILYCLFFTATVMFYAMFFLWGKSWMSRSGKLAIKFSALAFFGAIICLIVYALNIVPRGGF